MAETENPVYTALKKLGLDFSLESSDIKRKLNNKSLSLSVHVSDPLTSIQYMNETMNIMQKGIYLAEAAGVYLGYDFRWVNGPYSGELQDTFISILVKKKEGEEFSERAELFYMKKDTAEKVKELKSIFEKHAGNSEWFELAASLNFMNFNWSDTKKEKELVELAKKYTPKFEKKYVREVMDEIKFLF